jgi:hypothetical protein
MVVWFAAHRACQYVVPQTHRLDGRAHIVQDRADPMDRGTMTWIGADLNWMRATLVLISRYPS